MVMLQVKELWVIDDEWRLRPSQAGGHLDRCLRFGSIGVSRFSFLVSRFSFLVSRFSFLVFGRGIYRVRACEGDMTVRSEGRWCNACWNNGDNFGTLKRVVDDDDDDDDDG